MKDKHGVVIVGAGPAGLAVAGSLSHHGYTDYIVLDQAERIGHSWRNHYDRLHLHTVKRLSHLPHVPFPEGYPLYVSREQVVEYLESYAKQMDINTLLSQEVSSIVKEGTTWKVRTQSRELNTHNIVIATGVNRIPYLPTWPGVDEYKGSMIHSRSYKRPADVEGKSVLVIGMGNTGSEIALDLANAGKKVYLSVRSPISLVPRDLNGRPVQETARVLAKVPFGLGDWLGSQIRKIYFGNVSKYGLEISKLHPAVQLRTTGKTPVIDLGTIAAIKAEKIIVIKDIKQFHAQGAETVDDQHIEVDGVLLATGYRAKVEDFMPAVTTHLDSHNLPKDPYGTGELEGSYFVGFDNYKLGGILGTIRDDSQIIAKSIIKKVQKETT